VETTKTPKHDLAKRRHNPLKINGPAPPFSRYGMAVFIIMSSFLGWAGNAPTFSCVSSVCFYVFIRRLLQYLAQQVDNRHVGRSPQLHSSNGATAEIG